MKAQERHRLKTNELAQSLGDLLEYLRGHGTQILIVGVLVLVVLAAGAWWWGSRARSQQQQVTLLQDLLVRKDSLRFEAAQQARLEPAPQAPPPEAGFDARPLTKALADLSLESQGTPLSVTALLQQAEVLRSQLYFSSHDFTGPQKEQLCQEVSDIYQRIIREHPNLTWALGTARMGLALLAEDQGNWDQARQIYQEIIDQQQDKFAGTIFPQQARQRLKILDDIAPPIEFSSAPPVPAPSSLTPTAPTMPQSNPDAQIDEPSAQQKEKTADDSSKIEEVDLLTDADSGNGGDGEK